MLEHVRPLPAEPCTLAAAHGRVLAAAARAIVDLPPFSSSAMDGYAVRVEDVPGTLRVAGRAAAGRPAGVSLAPGDAIGIATGAVVPTGADAVVPVERVIDRGDVVEIPAPVHLSDNIRPRGGDVRAGDPVVPSGARLGSAQVGALAAAGIAEVACARRPALALLATGSELRPPGAPLRPGEIYESNAAMLAAAAVSAGADVNLIAPVADDEAAHREALVSGLQADVLVTTGGVSVGPHDLVRGVAAELGVEEVFWGVAVRPGRPLAFGVRGPTLVFGLPGNPVSALVGFELFVRPALLALQGASRPGPDWMTAATAVPLSRNPARDELVRARLETGAAGDAVRPLSGQESHMIVRAAAADVLVRVPRGEGTVAAGEAVRYLRLV